MANEDKSSSTDPDPYVEMCGTLGYLMANVGIVQSVMGQYPPHVQENFTKEIVSITQAALEEIEAIQTFGEAFDDKE